jgi:hypothetical protein
MFVNTPTADTHDLLRIDHFLSALQPVLFFILVLTFTGTGWAEEKLSLLNAARDGNLNQVERLINEGADVNQVDDSGYTPLMWAARNNHLEISRQLVHAGAFVEKQNKSQLTAIQIGSRFGNHKIARYLARMSKTQREHKINKRVIEERQAIQDYDRDQDGYIDFSASLSQMPPGMQDFTILETLPVCAQGKDYLIPAVKWALSQDKWRTYKITSNYIISARRRSYHIEIYFFPSKDKHMMGLRYINRKGRKSFLKRISRKTLNTFQFLCTATENPGQLVLANVPDRLKLKFSIPACSSREKALSLALISLRENDWDNIGVKYGQVVTADFYGESGFFKDARDQGRDLLANAMIEYSDDWTKGTISSGYSIGKDVMTELNNDKSLIKFNKRIRKKLARSYKLICR